jgi:hypothetical protein
MAQRLYQTVNNSFSEVSSVMEYYRSTYGFQPTIDDIQRYVYMYTVTTSKVPEEYSISDEKNIMSSNLVSSISRMEALEEAAANKCQDGGYREWDCKQPGTVCYECTMHNTDGYPGLPEKFQVCTTYTASSSLSNCKRVN